MKRRLCLLPLPLITVALTMIFFFFLEANVFLISVCVASGSSLIATGELVRRQVEEKKKIAI